MLARLSPFTVLVAVAVQAATSNLKGAGVGGTDRGPTGDREGGQQGLSRPRAPSFCPCTRQATHPTRSAANWRVGDGDGWTLQYSPDPRLPVRAPTQITSPKRGTHHRANQQIPVAVDAGSDRRSTLHAPLLAYVCPRTHCTQPCTQLLFWNHFLHFIESFS